MRQYTSLIKILCLNVAIILSTPSAFSWSQKGHDTTCAIAQKHLTDKALKEINALLEGKSMVYWSNWLDNASNTPKYAYTKTWHYKNIDAGQKFEEAELNENGDVVRAVNAQVSTLKSKKSSFEEKQLALKILIHLLGDMHQPMHMGHKSDLGGNKWKITYFKNETNIHSLWDSQLVESAHKWSHTEWVEEIDRLSDEEVANIVRGTVEQWAKETFEVATEVYVHTPEGSTQSYDYISRWTPVIEQQFLRGGHRLAYLLNSIFE